HDIVFATARAALEALCCGAAVIVCDARGLGGLVTSHNYERMRANNFGLRCLTRQVTRDAVLDELRCYDPSDAAIVAARARDEADLGKHLDHLEGIYATLMREIVAEPVKPDDFRRALLLFLHET